MLRKSTVENWKKTTVLWADKLKIIKRLLYSLYLQLASLRCRLIRFESGSFFHSLPTIARDLCRTMVIRQSHWLISTLLVVLCSSCLTKINLTLKVETDTGDSPRMFGIAFILPSQVNQDVIQSYQVNFCSLNLNLKVSRESWKPTFCIQFFSKTLRGYNTEQIIDQCMVTFLIIQRWFNAFLITRSINSSIF